MIEAFLSNNAWNAINLLLDYFLILFFFRRVQAEKAKYSVLGYAALALISILYLHSNAVITASSVRSAQNFANQFLRNLLYIFSVWLYLRLSKNLDFKKALYLALFYSVFYIFGRNLMTYIRAIAESLSTSSFATKALTSGIAFPVKYLVAWYTAKELSFDDVKTDSSIRWTSVLFLNFIGLFFKFSLITVMQEEIQTMRYVDNAVYPFLAIFSTYTVLFLMEKQFLEQEQKQRYEMDMQRREYELSNAHRMLQNADDVRRIYHDMKNHLLMIRSLDSSAQAAEYADQVLENMAGYENSVKTGNEVVDCFLSAKIEQSILDGISFNICADLSRLPDISPMDLISIFGNALDNAIEAVKMIDNKERRIVFVKTSYFAGSAIVRFSNPYTGYIKKENGRLLTTKSEIGHHGLGSGSIKRAVERNGGTVNYEIDEDKKRFSLIISLPLNK